MCCYYHIVNANYFSYCSWQGFGSRVLKQSGWREGQGVGASNQGIAAPLDLNGQLPTVKKGLG